MIPLCKAKTLEGKWVEGYAYQKDTIGNVFIHAIELRDENLIEISDIKVRPETVCLWTGKTDKGKVKIYYGDRRRIVDVFGERVGTVIWDEDMMCPMMKFEESIRTVDAVDLENTVYCGSIHDKEGER
jgi:hypothetical protein